MLRIVADLGNSRLKWARLGADGRPTASVALPLDEPSAWAKLWKEWHLEEPGECRWVVSSVNPPVARALSLFLREHGISRVAWFQTAAEVPVKNEVEGADTGGADRALAVLAAERLKPAGRPGLVVSCGTAITIERITAEGIWQGGVIAQGLGLTARALHAFTAQLPLVNPDSDAPSWGRSTEPSLEAGVFWGTVGAVRELLARQSLDLPGDPWVVWTGGDARLLAPSVTGAEARIIPDLVLQGLALVLESIPA